MPQLLDLCPEVLHNILQEVQTTDLAALSRCCHFLNSSIRNDVLLWKNHYLKQFDYPGSTHTSGEGFWNTKVAEVIALQKLLETKNTNVKRTHLARVAKTVLELLEDPNVGSSPSLNIAFLVRLFDSANKSAFMGRSSLFQKTGSIDVEPASTESERQLSAKLYCYYGMSLEPSKEEIEKGLAKPIHPVARSRVYDLRNYNEKNYWGPFQNDEVEAVDWEKVQRIMAVLTYNLLDLHNRTEGRFSLAWKEPFTGVATNSLVSRSLEGQKAQPRTALDDEDPYGVSGHWRRVVCFLDYNNLYSFNFQDGERQRPDDQERPPITTEEAIRLIKLNLRVKKIVAPGEDDHPDWPVVHFIGTSKSMHMSWDPNANSRIRGTVRTTPSGAIRWTTFSIYHGEYRWRSEGVQIGGRKSGRGVIGTWFDTNFDPHGPAGPSAFWKMSDDIAAGTEGEIDPFPFAAFS